MSSSVGSNVCTSITALRYIDYHVVVRIKRQGCYSIIIETADTHSYLSVFTNNQYIEGNELFYAMLYLSYFTSGPLYIFYILAVVCFPVALLKSGIALLQGYLAATNLVGVDLKERQEMKKD